MFRAASLNGHVHVVSAPLPRRRPWCPLVVTYRTCQLRFMLDEGMRISYPGLGSVGHDVVAASPADVPLPAPRREGSDGDAAAGT